MAIALVASTAAGGTASSCTTSGIDTTGADFLIMVVGYQQGGTTSISDSKGNTWNALTESATGSAEACRMYYSIPSSVGTSHTFSNSGSSNYSSIAVFAFSGVEQSSPIDQQNGTSNSSSTIQAGSVTPTTDNQLVFAGVAWNLGRTTEPPTINSSFTGVQGTAFSSGNHYGSAGAYIIQTTASATNPTWDFGNSWTNSARITTIKAASSATLEQEGFAFGDDDGSESTHTLGTQDTNHSGNLGTKTLRALVNATGDPSANAYTLRYQKNGSGGYTAVPVGSTTYTQPVIEVGDCTESGNNTASGSWAISHPNASTGDLLIWNLAWDDSTNTTDVTAPSGPNGETLNVIQGPTADSGTAVRGKCWYTVATGSWTASTLTFTPSANEQWTAVVIRVPAGEFDSTTPIGASDSEGTSGTTSTPTTCTFTAGSTDRGTLVNFFATDVDNCDGTMTGWTSLVSTDRGVVGIDVSVRTSAVTTSESITGTTGYTLPSARAQVAFDYIVRSPGTTNEVYVSTSSNVASGGEATTARLTAPSGKTSGSDFVTGRRWDDENGTDTIDITTDDYTEVEWVLTTQSPAASSDYFEFRVYNGASALDTYTVTPKWTISSAALSVSVSDTSTITDTPTIRLVSYPSVSDTVTITDTPTVSLVSYPSVSDTATVSDTPTLNAKLLPTVSDTVTVSDTPTLSLISYISVSDGVTVSDSPTILIPTLVPSVSDTVTVTDTPTVLTVLNLSVSDGVTVTDLPYYLDDVIQVSEQVTISIVSAVADLNVSVSDTVTVTDSTALSLVSYINVSDTITATDSITVLLTYLVVSVSDQVTTTDSPTLDAKLLPSASDTATITDTPDVRINVGVQAGDTVTTNDTPIISLTSNFLVSDTVTTTDTPTLRVDLPVSVADTVTLSEDVNLTVSSPQVVVEDTVTITDTPTVFIPTLTLSVEDTATITDSPTLLLISPGAVSVNDTVTVTDSPSVYLVNLVLTVTDGVTVTDSPTLSLTSYVQASDTVTAGDSATVAVSGTGSVVDYYTGGISLAKRLRRGLGF